MVQKKLSFANDYRYISRSKYTVARHITYFLHYDTFIYSDEPLLFQNFFEKARIYFERSKDFDFQSMYMLSCMLYDGQGGKQDEVSCYH